MSTIPLMDNPVPFSLFAMINYMAALHGFVLALIIKKKSRQSIDSNSVLALIMGFSSFMLACATLYNGGGFRIWPHLVLIFDPFILLVPPLLYLYVKTRIQGSLTWQAGLAVHLAPILINLLILFPFYTMNGPDKIRYYLSQLQHPSPLSPVMLLRIITPTLYILFSIIILIRHSRSLRKIPEEAHRKNLAWLWHLMLGLLVVWTVIALIHGYIPKTISEEEFSHLSNLLSSILIFAIGYRVLLHPEILNPEIKTIEPPKYQKTGLSELDSLEIWQKLSHRMTEELVYLEPSLGLSELAEQIGVPPHQLSQVINQQSGDNFFTYINRQRIAHAQQIMRDDHTTKLLSIAFSSGFQSLSTFNRVFREMTGMTPSVWRSRKPKAS